MFEEGLNFAAREDDWNARGALCADDFFEHADLDVEDVAIEIEDGIERLVLRGGGDLLIDGERSEILFDVRFAECARIGECMEFQIAADPCGVGFFGAASKAENTHPLSVQWRVRVL